MYPKQIRIYRRKVGIIKHLDKWIHHDYYLFGENRLGKYPKAEVILRKYSGDERFEQGRGYYPSFSPFVRIEEPDLKR